jgi:TM2 domain-containing membrane protein YozV
MRKSRVGAAFIALLGGFLGLHKFYLRDPGAGFLYVFLMIVTARIFPVSMLLGFFDAIKLFSMTDEKFDQKYNNVSSSFRTRAERRMTRKDEIAQRKIVNERERYHYTAKTKRVRDNPFKRSGDLKYKDYDLEEAVEDYKKALDITPEDAEINFNMAAVYSLLEKKELSFYHLEKAISLGFSPEKINTLDDLAFLRIQPEFESFKNNGFKLQGPKGIEMPKVDMIQGDLLLSQLNKLKDLRTRGLLSPKEFEYEKEKLLRK